MVYVFCAVRCVCDVVGKGISVGNRPTHKSAGRQAGKEIKETKRSQYTKPNQG